MSDKLLEALRQLDANNAEHWTQDGAPRLDVVKKLSGDSAVTREAVTAAWVALRDAPPAPPAPAPAPQEPPKPWQQAPQAATAAPQATPAPAGPAATPSEPAKALQSAVQIGGDDGSVQETASSDPRGSADGAVQAAASLSEAQAVADPQERLAALRRHLENAEDYHAHATRILKEAQAAVDRELEAQPAVTTAENLSASLRGYFDRQQDIRNERAARIDAMKGVKLSDVLPTRAKIDEAFARRNGRGTKRPTGGV